MAALLFPLQWVSSSTRGNFHPTLRPAASGYLPTHLPGLHSASATNAGFSGYRQVQKVRGHHQTFLPRELQGPAAAASADCCTSATEGTGGLWQQALVSEPSSPDTLLSGKTAFSPREATKPSSPNSKAVNHPVAVLLVYPGQISTWGSVIQDFSCVRIIQGEILECLLVDNP